jgi:dipeptidyl aminopeptidase/acylaminoacyl peptidase
LVPGAWKDRQGQLFATGLFRGNDDLPVRFPERILIRRVFALLLLAGLAQAESDLTWERALDSGPSFSAYLVSYESDGLKVHAMVAVPDAELPPGGFPVVIANHGYVPDPRKHGITAEGRDSRPGDYYRSVPELFASRGFLVVLPDYRGHNSSEGYEQIAEQNRESIGLYARDVIALMHLLAEIEHADMDNVFMWSHSMGGAVSLRAQLKTSLVKAASYWSTMPLSDLADRYADLKVPVMIQHGIGDESTAVENSREFRGGLEAAAVEHIFHEYDTADHYFTGELRETAADRDAEFFRSQIN